MTLLTTLIPAFKPDHLGETLDGLRRQSWRDFRVILSDDSPGGVITDMLRDRRFGPVADELQMLVVRGPGNARRNHQHLLDQWAGSSPLVHFMMDDDVVFPGFYQAHVLAHTRAQARGRIALSASPRWFSHINAKPVSTTALPDFITGSTLREVPVTAEQVFESVVVPCQNWIGELSNMVWSAEGIAHYPKPPPSGLSYYGLLDISAVLHAIEHLPMVFIHDHLSVFRQHAQQTTRGVGSHGHRVTMLVWAACALHAWKAGRITDSQAVQAIGTTVQRCLQLYPEGDAVMNGFYDVVQNDGLSLARLHAAFGRYWQALLASHPSTAPAAAAAHCEEALA